MELYYFNPSLLTPRHKIALPPARQVPQLFAQDRTLHTGGLAMRVTCPLRQLVTVLVMAFSVLELCCQSLAWLGMQLAGGRQGDCRPREREGRQIEKLRCIDAIGSADFPQ